MKIKHCFLLLLFFVIPSCGFHSTWLTLGYSDSAERESGELQPAIEIDEIGFVKINPNSIEEVSESKECNIEWSELNFKVWVWEKSYLSLAKSSVHVEGEIGIMKFVQPFNFASIESGTEIHLQESSVVSESSLMLDNANWFQVEISPHINCKTAFEVRLVFIDESGKEHTKELYFRPERYRKLDH